MEEHSSNYPGCRRFNMIDLDKKVANRICANTKGAEDVIMLDNKGSKNRFYEVKIKTGCKNEPRKGERFCPKCMSYFSLPGKSKQAICFLQSLHPMVKRKPISQRDV